MKKSPALEKAGDGADWFLANPLPIHYPTLLGIGGEGRRVQTSLQLANRKAINMD